ncbi:MAG TPA: ABC transporter ATP-binding protein [Terracidiphilus sp.]|nr:ABC transporter ATP-binding protein [Terracidiphilus sp.]
MNALLTFSNVGFSYGERSILRDLTATVCANACIALVGPNGAGKTTLLRLAAGTLHPQSGEVLLQARSLASLSRRTIARSIALVPQDVEVPFPFTVEQFVELGRTPYLELFGGPRAEDREALERALELTDTAHLRARVFNQLSGGERQRVKIALGLAQNPRLLLLDEPTQHLDIGRQLEVTALIQKLAGEGIAIVASMHDLALIEDAFSSVWLLDPGNPMLQGTPRELLHPELLERVFDCPPRSKILRRESILLRREAIFHD